MKLTCSFVAVLCTALCGIAARPADAGPIFLSGDSNITNALNGTFGAPIDAGNQLFFLNILQGGTSVLISTDYQNPNFPEPELTFVNAIDSFYDTHGVSSNITTSPLTDLALQNIDLFVAVKPNTFSASEIDSLIPFLDSGGSVFFIGEGVNALASNTAINQALLAIGSNLAIRATDTFYDSSQGCLSNFHTLSGAAITNDPFTSGVSTFTCAAGVAVYSRNNAGFGSTTLFTETNGAGVVIYEPYGTPYVAPVPEPGSFVLLGSGLAFAARRRRLVRRKLRRGSSL